MPERTNKRSGKRFSNGFFEQSADAEKGGNSLLSTGLLRFGHLDDLQPHRISIKIQRLKNKLFIGGLVDANVADIGR